MSVRFGAQIIAAAADHHLDPRLLAAVAAQETGGPGANSGRNIVGDRGHGHGVFQIDDRSWAFARSHDAMDPLKNAEMAATILAENLHAYGGDLRQALSAYNAGSPHAVGTRTTWADGKTLGYADSVLRHYAALAGEFGTHDRHAPAEHVATRAAATHLAAGATTPAPDPGEPKSLGGAPGAPQSLGGGSGATKPSPGFPILGAGLGLVPTAPQPVPFASTVPWTQLTRAGAEATSEADRSMAELIDGDGIDAFDDGT